MKIAGILIMAALVLPDVVNIFFAKKYDYFALPLKPIKFSGTFSALIMFISIAVPYTVTTSVIQTDIRFVAIGISALILLMAFSVCAFILKPKQIVSDLIFAISLVSAAAFCLYFTPSFNVETDILTSFLNSLNPAVVTSLCVFGYTGIKSKVSIFRLGKILTLSALLTSSAVFGYAVGWLSESLL